LNARKLILWLAENWPAKVLSVALALILFVFHEMSTLTTRTMIVPLAIETNSALAPGGAYPRNVRVRLRGESDGVKSILENDIEAYLDFTGHESEGQYRAPVQIRRKGSALVPEPLEITVNPLEVSVNLDKRVNKAFPLTAILQGNAAAGFELVSYSVSPIEIAMSGPLRIMESINDIKTDPIDIDGRKSDFSVMVNIANPNPLLLSIRGDAYAEFRCVIRQSVPVRNIDGIAIDITGLDLHFESDLGGRTGSVRLEAVQSLLDNFSVQSGFLSVDCSEITGPGTYTLPVNVDLPEGFILIRHEPEEVSVTITLENSEQGESNDYRHRD
jgi:YbbR domain-containing protein